MKILKRTKKGFTLVELIVVIAIVAILAAVSVVSYLAFINQANESADIQLVKQLNVALQADQALNGPRNTMHEMLGVMEDNGFVVENLTKTKSGYDIVWDQNANRFALLDNKENLIYGEDSYNDSDDWQIWKFADTQEEAQNKNYSVYLTEEFVNSNVPSLAVKAGLDVGNYDKLTSIKYENISSNKQDVVIRTNGGSLTINAENDTVRHYGYTKVLDVQAIASASYHEYGTSGFVRLAKGHFVVESKGIVNVLYATGTKTGDSKVVVDNNDGIIGKAYATDDTVANYDTDGETPKQDGNVVLVKDESVTNEVIAAVTTTSIVETLSNPTSDLYTTLNTTIEANTFRGEGTANSPYLISNVNELEILRQRVASGNEYTGKNFKLTQNIDLSSIKDWKGIGTGGGSGQFCFEGIFDGDGKTISGLRANNATSEGFGLFSYVRNATIKNFTISDAQIVSTKKIGLVVGMSFGNVDFEDITVEKDCSITGSSTIGGLIGNIAISKSSDDSKHAEGDTVTIKNLVNKATVTCNALSQSATQRVGGIIGNIQKIDEAPKSLLTIELSGLVNEGTVTCDFSGGILGGVQSSMCLSRESPEENFPYRVLKFKECINKDSSVKGEFIGYLDGGAKYIEFYKCKVSSNLNNYVDGWNSSLVYCRTENGQYTANLFFVDNGTTRHTYIIAMNQNKKNTYYGDITDTATTTVGQFNLFLTNHTVASNNASYSQLNECFGNGHGFVNIIDTADGLFIDIGPTNDNNKDQCYAPYKVIEVVG